MSDANQEPTMEEILASIRRIISEDDPPADGEAPAPAPAAEVSPAEEPRAVIEEPLAPVEEEDDEVLELTQRIEPEPVAHEPLVETHGDLDTYREAEPEPLRPAARAEEPASSWSARDEEPLIGRGAAATAATAFGQLAQSLSMPKEGRTLEDVVAELLRPLLKNWLDEHLPDIVKAKVEAEVERIARARGR